MSINQADLVEAVQQSYLEHDGALEQKELYRSVASKLGVNPEAFYEPVGNQKRVNLYYRKVRWAQQSLKDGKLLQRVKRGYWELTGRGKSQLHAIKDSKSIIAMSTSLGVMICSKTESVFEKDIITEDIDLVVTSPPYVLQNPRLYGGTNDAREWVSFVMRVMNAIAPRLSDGASIALNVGTDSFHEKMPARQTHIERLVIAMEDAGFYLVDRLCWNSNKAPTPTQWTSVNRFMLRSSYELVLHFTNNPLKLMTDNQRVLIPHSDAHRRYVLSGGAKRATSHSDGAHRQRVGGFSKTDLSKGKIPTNSFYFANKCVENERVNRAARALGVPTHGAKMPYRLAKFLVEYLCPIGGVALDPFGGTGAIAAACEELNRHWISIEMIRQYILQSFSRFSHLGDDVWFNSDFAMAA